MMILRTSGTRSTLAPRLNVRVGRAVQMLKEGKATVTETAYACGFNTIRSFNRTFKKATGYTPSALPRDYVYLYRVRKTDGVDPTLSCTLRIE